MFFTLNHPLLVLALSILVLYLSEWTGAILREHRPNLEKDEREDFGLIVTASLTLLGLIIGFTFSMAISRYDQRKNYEEAEANAIGTEYVRADLLPAADAAKVRKLLRSYLDERLFFYETSDYSHKKIDAATSRLQAELWDAVRAPALNQQTPVMALTLSGMNDVLNSQGYTQAAWWNRIPGAAWSLMAAIAIACTFLIGYGMHRANRKNFLLLVLPIVVATSFFLISDIDSPRGGIIRVRPQNLTSLAQSLDGQ